MHSFWKLTLVLAIGGLLLIAPLLASAAAPDMYVKILSIVREPPLQPTVWKVDVAVGNAGTVAPSAAVYAFLRAGTASGPVCETGLPNIQGKLIPGTVFKAFRFQVTYPAPTPIKKLPVVRYTIAAEVKYLNYSCQQGVNDNNCTDNLKNVTLAFPAGGTPSCVKLVQ
jgi:hypothetical protein